jgi:hypothetical protein
VEIVCASSHAAHKGFLFLGAGAEGHVGPERVLDLLNGDDDFIVFEDEAGGVNLLRRGGVSRVTLATEDTCTDPKCCADPNTADLDLVAKIRLVFEDRSELEGTTRYQLPTERCRIQDFLNAPGAFIPLYHGVRLTLVNKHRLTRVIPL